MRRVLLAVCAFAALCATAAGADAPALPLTQVDVSNLATAQSETMVAVDPSNPKVLLAGSNNESLLAGTLAYTSTDGGATWVTSRPWALDPKDFQCSVGDPVTAIDDRGRQLIGYIVIPCLAGERVQRLSLYVSRRESATAPWTVTRVPAPTGPNGPANDKPAIAWDVSTASPHHGRVYLTWTRLKRTEISVVLSYSDDGGATWSPPAPVDRAPRQGTASFFATVATSPAGDVYVGWTTQSHEVDLARSSDGGATFAPPVRVDTVLSLPAPFGSACAYRGQTIPAQPRRCVSVNPVVVASSTRVYVVYAVAGADGHEQDVRVTTLDSALAPVGPSAQVNTPDGATVSDQFQPSAALDPVSGLLWLCFYDTTGDRTRRSTRYACAVSRDGAAWSATLPVASARSNETLKGALKGFEYGDYQGLAVGTDGVAHPIWTDARDLRSRREEIYTTSLVAANFGY